MSQTIPFNTLIRLPNWLGDVVMALPIIRAMHTQGTHKITLLAQPHFKPFLERLDCFDEVIYLPQKSWLYYFKLWPLKKYHFTHHVLFTYSERTDLEAFIIHAKQRYGILRPTKKRPLLTHHFPLSDEFDEVHTHQTRLFAEFAYTQGLLSTSDVDLSPLTTPTQGTHNRLGLICGTENTPEKRWPIHHWVSLINHLAEQRPDTQLLLLGTAKDKAITNQIEQAVSDSARKQLNNLAGQTNLSGFMDKLCECDAVICNDTGGMHLANALGVPVVSLFGPTNPVRTGPIFNGTGTLLQPEDAPKTGGVDIANITHSAVLSAIEHTLNTPPQHS